MHKHTTVLSLVLLLCLMPCPGLDDEEAASGHGESRFRLRLDIDLATVVLEAAHWAGASPIGDATAGESSTTTCNTDSVNAFDRHAMEHPPVRAAADVLSFLPVAYLAIDMADAGVCHWRTYLTDLWVVAQALGRNGPVLDLLRRAVPTTSSEQTTLSLVGLL